MASKRVENYVALLRGINVGGNTRVPMEDLRTLCGRLGYAEVKTLLNSGNLVFTHQKTGRRDLENTLGAAFKKKFGFESKIIIRTRAEIDNLRKLDPFKEIKAGEDIQLYVTFLRDEAEGGLKLPYSTPGKEMQILKNTGSEVFSVILRGGTETTKFMAFLEKAYGKDITTRNWNTILKIAALWSM